MNASFTRHAADNVSKKIILKVLQWKVVEDVRKNNLIKFAENNKTIF